MSESDRQSVAALCNTCAAAATRHLQLQAAVRRRLLDLVPSDRAPKLTSRLHDWWTLDFAGFHAEIKRAFRAEIPVHERDDWERYLLENAAQVRSLTATIENAEREIDSIVYRLFELTDTEIDLLEKSIEGQY